MIKGGLQEKFIVRGKYSKEVTGQVRMSARVAGFWEGDYEQRKTTGN